MALSERIMGNGVKQGAVAPGTLLRFSEILQLGVGVPDAGYRATAVAYGLRQLAEGIASMPPTPMSEHQPADNTPWSPSNPACPRCGLQELTIEEETFMCRGCGHCGECGEWVR